MSTPTASIVQPPRARVPLQWLSNRSLRTKLILAFITVVAFSVGIVAFFATRATQATLSEHADENLHDAAEVRALIIADWLDQQIHLLSTLSVNEVIQEEVEEVSSAYQGDEATILVGIAQIDQQWATAEDTSELVQNRLHNLVSGELAEVFPNNSSAFVTDKYGALVGALTRTPAYAQADTDWWQAAYNQGQGAVYIGQPQGDADGGNPSLIMALPLYGEDSSEAIGVLHISYSLEPLTTKLAAVRFGETGDADVLLPNGQLLRSEGNLVPMDAQELLSLRQHAGSIVAEFDYDHERRLVSQVPLTAREGQSAAITTLGWTLIVDQDPAEIFAPIRAAGRSTLLAGLAVLIVASVLAFIFAQTISAPIQLLTQTVQQIASGDLGSRMTLQRRDEIGLLASGVNTMADSLATRIAAEQQAQAEARRLQQDEVESRERLEQAVAEYLTFVQQVAQGDLTRRLVVHHDDRLGQLGQGLNGMVESLQRISSQVQDATSAIAAAAAEILAATAQQAASAAEQSAAITQTTTTIEEVKVIATQTADRAGQVAHDGQAALTIARQGTGAVEETVNGMRQIRVRVESIATTILALAEQTQAIGTIIAMVGELADQSNLLALNAAIEAARAGEQGRSFAVVAQHVRALAEQSKGATVQVKAILSEIQKATQTAVLVTEEGTKGVESGGQLAASAGTVIHRIAEEVENGAQASVQIAAAAQQQTAGMVQIGQAMANIQQATTQTLASTRQAERAAQDLHTLSQSLQQVIMTYRL